LKKNLYIIAGCNGAGKTIASFTILPDILNCREFVNADEIARGLSPFQPEKVSFEAGRIMLNRIQELLFSKQDFAFETTLATKSFKNTIIKAKNNNFNVILLFFWLNKVELAIERVKIRVKEGGHHIPSDIIKRRYKRGIQNLFSIYLPIADEFMLFDNSSGEVELIANKIKDDDIKIYNFKTFKNIQNDY